ncbi:MAG: hypothetical protein KC502_21100, partial [Myxococcales bacterium]|nr:hypothetical protein [Myxococcales bacterium]
MFYRFRHSCARLTFAIAVGAALIAGGSPSTVAASTPQESKALQLTAQAKSAYKAGKYVQAAMLFKRAYAQVPEPTLLFNAARAYQRGAHLREALSMFRLYLTLATHNDEETRAGRSEAVAHISEIDKRLQRQAEAQRAKNTPKHGQPPPTVTPPSAAKPAGTTPRQTTPAVPPVKPAVGPSPPQTGPPAAVPTPTAPLTTQKPVHRPGLFSRVSADKWTEREIAAVSLMAGGGAMIVTGLILHAVASSTLSELDEDMARRTTSQGGVTYYSGITQKAGQQALDSHDGLRLGGNMTITLGLAA